MEQNKETFEYTYSAAQQAEVEKIRRKYIAKEDDKLTLLKKLDASVTKKGIMAGITIGVIGMLVFGGGLSCCMLFGDTLLLQGILLGIAGIVIMLMAYPMYNKITAKERERIAPEILALAEELGR